MGWGNELKQRKRAIFRVKRGKTRVKLKVQIAESRNQNPAGGSER
jgi:hypothetical protein